MNCDLVLIATNVIQEIISIVSLNSKECTTILEIDSTTISCKIQHNQPLPKKDRIKIFKKIKKLEKIFKTNYIIVILRSISFGLETKIEMI